TGIRHGPEPDRILATVLFTDIVGSTKRAVELGDRDWRELLEQHHAIVRRQLARFRGHEVNIAGDGFLATFDGPGRAIRCAVSICREVRSLGSTSGLDFTVVSARSRTARWRGSPCISGAVSRPQRSPVRCLSQAP